VTRTADLSPRSPAHPKHLGIRRSCPRLYPPGHSVTTVSDLIRIGGRRASLTEARTWVEAYFDRGNQNSRTPYAYPAYDEYQSGSGPFELNDGDLLAPTLLNAAPTVRAFYSLQEVRADLTEALTRIPVDLRLADSLADGTMPDLIGDLATVLDEPERLAGVRLTTLFKVLHRKRPDFVPLYDQFVGACYLGQGDEFPVRRMRRRSWRHYAVAVTAAVSADLTAQEAVFGQLQPLAPGVSTLRLLDVLAWKVGRRPPASDPVCAPAGADDDRLQQAAEHTPTAREQPS